MSQYGDFIPRRAFDPAFTRSAYVPHDREPFVTTGESLAQQHMAAECDINNIVQRYLETGILEHKAKGSPSYGDVATGLDFQEAMQTVTSAREMFGALPSSIRKEFGNDPAKFLDFVTDPANAEAMVQMGLAEPAPEPPVVRLEATEDETGEYPGSKAVSKKKPPQKGSEEPGAAE